MYLVDEQDNVPEVFYFLNNASYALLKIAAVFRPREHCGKVEAVYLLFEQLVGNASFRNTQGNSLGYRGFSDTAFADKAGVVLSPAEEDLYCLGYFAVAAENGVDLALSRERSQIFSVFFESCPRFKRL